MGGFGLSDTVLALFLDTPNVGPLENSDGEGWAGSMASGRTMRIQVRLEGEHVAEARFGTYGCAPAIAAGAYVTRWARARTFDEVERLTPSDVLVGLGGLPVHRRHCAALAVEALKGAVRDARQNTKGGPKP